MLGPTRQARAKPRRSGWLTLALGGLLGAGVFLAAMRDSRPSEAAPAPATDSIVRVHLPRADQTRITSWPEFFACYSLVRDDSVIVATLRENNFMADATWRPDREIKLVLRPAEGSLTATPAEKDILTEVTKLTSAMTGPGTSPCNH